MKKIFTWWGIIFGIIVLGIIAFVPDPAEKSNTLGGLAMAAVISLFFIFKSLNEEYSGIITEIKTEKRYETDDDGFGQTYEVNYAYLKLDNGQTKKLKAYQDWKVGDRLEKKRGQPTPKIISKT